jgi:L-asparaginase II
MAAVDLVQLWRGDLLESVHQGHAVVCDASGEVVMAWGDPEAIVYPRSSSKMIQALPLLESGAAAAAGLGPEHLALACASHQGAAVHTQRVEAWLAHLGLSEADLRCGAHMPSDKPSAEALIRANEKPCQIHNNCSGKHAGFLTLGRHLGAGPDYVEVDHPVQCAIHAAWEEVTEESTAGWGVDGCSAPNFASSLAALGRAMASFASAGSRSGARAQAQQRLTQAMIAHPDLVAGEGRACTELMRACEGRAALKTGAEGFFVGILPEQGLGIALKIADGATRASEAVVAALLVKLGVLDAGHPVAQRLSSGVQRNWRGLVTGRIETLL